MISGALFDVHTIIFSRFIRDFTPTAVFSLNLVTPILTLVTSLYMYLWVKFVASI